MCKSVRDKPKNEKKVGRTADGFPGVRPGKTSDRIFHRRRRLKREGGQNEKKKRFFFLFA
jgi:hypothetical protein